MPPPTDLGQKVEHLAKRAVGAAVGRVREALDAFESHAQLAVEGSPGSLVAAADALRAAVDAAVVEVHQAAGAREAVTGLEKYAEPEPAEPEPAEPEPPPSPEEPTPAEPPPTEPPVPVEPPVTPPVEPPI